MCVGVRWRTVRRAGLCGGVWRALWRKDSHLKPPDGDGGDGGRHASSQADLEVYLPALSCKHCCEVESHANLEGEGGGAGGGGGVNASVMMPELNSSAIIRSAAQK